MWNTGHDEEEFPGRVPAYNCRITGFYVFIEKKRQTIKLDFSKK